MQSDGIAAVHEPDVFRIESLRAGFPELDPQPMSAPPSDGRCPRATMWKSSCKSRGCPVCGPRWARNQRTKIGSNLAYQGGKFATIAITAPGKDVLPWDEDYCRSRRGPHTHSGTKGCRVEQRPLREWCETLGFRWAKLRNAAQQATYRATREKYGEGERVWVIERVWEPQKRGAPHCHLVVPFGTPRERYVANLFRDELERLADDYGFGSVQGKLQAISGEQAARYLASYLAGRRRKKNSIRENIGDPRLPKSLLWETPVLSSVSASPRMSAWRERYGIRIGTGITMRTLRRARHFYACLEGFCEEFPRWSGYEEAVTVAAVFRRTNPTRAGPRFGAFDEENFPVVLEYARAHDREAARRGGYDLSYWDPRERQWLPNQPLYRRMILDAFRWTTAAPVAA